MSLNDLLLDEADDAYRHFSDADEQSFTQRLADIISTLHLPQIYSRYTTNGHSTPIHFQKVTTEAGVNLGV